MILLQILDEGTITDSQGRKVDFKVIPFSAITSRIIHWNNQILEHHHLSDKQPRKRYPRPPDSMRPRNRCCRRRSKVRSNGTNPGIFPTRAAQPARLHHGIQQTLAKLDSQSRFVTTARRVRAAETPTDYAGRGRCGAPVAREPWVLGCIWRACDRESCENRCVVPVGAEVVEGYDS